MIPAIMPKTDLKPLIDAAMSRFPLAEVLHQHGVSLKRSGSDYVALCPFHSEKTPSFHVYAKENRYHCYGCGAHGDTIRFLMQHDGLHFLEAVSSLAGMAGVPLPEHFSTSRAGSDEWKGSVPGVFGLRRPRVMGETPKRFREPKKTWESPAPPNPAEISQCQEIIRIAVSIYQEGLSSPLAQAYLRERNITNDVADRFCLGYADGSSSVCRHMVNAGEDVDWYEKAGVIARKGDRQEWADRFRNRLIFPIRDEEGRFCGIGGRYIAPPTQGFGKPSFRPKYINTPETPAYHKSQMLYGLYESRKSMKSTGRAILVEGYLDVIGLHQEGIENAVASCGTALTDAQIALLLRHASEVVLCFDGDDAGRAAASKAAEKCLEYLQDGIVIRVAFLPNGKDPHDLMQTPDGRETFDKLVLDAPSVMDVLTRSLLDRIPVVDPNSADRFLTEFGYYRDRVPGDINRKAWESSVALIVHAYRRIDVDSEMVSCVASDHGGNPHPQVPSQKTRILRPAPKLSEAFIERAIWWVFHLPWEDSVSAWESVPVSWFAYLKSPALEQLSLVLRTLPQGLDDAQTAGIRAILKKVDDQRDFQDVVRRMDADAKKSEVSAMVRKVTNAVTRGRIAFIAAIAERDGVGALTEDEQRLLRTGCR